MKNKQFDSIIRNKLHGYSIEPSEGANSLIISAIKHKRRIRLFKKISIAASLLVAFALTTYMIESDGLVNDVITDDATIIDTHEPSLKEEMPGSERITIVAADPDNAHEESLKSENKEITHDNLAVNGINKSIKPDEQALNERDITQNDNEQMIAAEASRESEIPDTLRNEILFMTTLEFEPLSIPDQERVEEMVVESPEVMKKITIEYIASGTVTKRSKVKKMYEKLENLKTPDEMLADIRTIKDQLFALEFIKKDKEDKTQNKE